MINKRMTPSYFFIRAKKGGWLDIVQVRKFLCSRMLQVYSFVIHGNPKFTMISQVQASRFHWTIASKEGHKGFGETLDTVLYLSNLGKDRFMQHYVCNSNLGYPTAPFLFAACCEDFSTSFSLFFRIRGVCYCKIEGRSVVKGLSEVHFSSNTRNSQTNLT